MPPEGGELILPALTPHDSQLHLRRHPVKTLRFRAPAFGARNPHFRDSKQLQIPRFARNDNLVQVTQYFAVYLGLQARIFILPARLPVTFACPATVPDDRRCGRRPAGLRAEWSDHFPKEFS